MLTHFFKSINWVDIGLLFLLVRIIFIGVKNGFITEFFKFLGVLTAVFVSLHYYSGLSAWLAQKTGFSGAFWEMVTLLALWFILMTAFKFLRDGILMLFKMETTHQGFDKYAGGVLAVGRG